MPLDENVVDATPTPIKITETTTVEARPERPENWRTLLLVSAIIGAGIVFAAYAITGPRWGTFCLFLAVWEGWTLVNKYKDDTISEAIWILSKRPVTVLLFGLGMGIAGGSGYLGDPTTVLRAFSVGLLYGHFFFPKGDTETVKTTRGVA